MNVRLYLSCCASLLCASLLCANDTSTPKPQAKTDVDVLFDKLKEDPPISKRDLTDGLIRLGSSAVPHILQYLNEAPDESALDAIFKAISEIDDKDTVSNLISLTEANTKAVQIAAINALGQRVTPETITVLTKIMMEPQDIDLFTSAQAGVIAILRNKRASGDIFNTLTQIATEGGKTEKIRAIHCIGVSGNERAGRVLLGFLGDKDMGVVIGTIVALGRLRISDPRICSKLRRFLKDRNPYIKKEAAMTLGRLRDIESIPDLIDLLDDGHPGMTDTAHWALKQISGMQLAKNPAHWDAWWRAEDEKYQTEMDDLLEELNSKTKGRMVNAIRSLSRMIIGREEVVDNLLQFISDNDPMIRREVCSALGITKASQAVPDLIACLDDSDNTVKNTANRALQQITDQVLPPDRDKWEEWKSSQ